MRKTGSPLSRWVAVAVLPLLAACAGAHRGVPESPVAALSGRSSVRRPVVIIPGLLGTRLEDAQTHQIVWGGVKGLLGGDTAYALALPLDPGETDRLEPAGLVADVAGVDIYESILKTLQRRGGYVAGTDHPATRAAYFVFDYDWRQSCAVIAAGLDRKIRAIQALYGDPNLKVDIVAHSMGGLVARYYLLYGGRDVREEPDPQPDYAGVRNVGTLVLLGTPNLGAAGALKACIEGRTIGLTAIPPEVFATGPSMYELLPSPSVPAVFEADGRPAALDIYDPASWRRMGWGIFDPKLVAGIRKRFLERHRGASAADADRHMSRLYETFSRCLTQAAGFYRAIEAEPVPSEVRVVLIGGDCVPTLKALVVEREGTRLETRFAPDQVRHPVPGVDLKGLFYGPGDGQVTASSLLGSVPAGPGGERPGDLPPDTEVVFVCAHHTRIVRNATFRETLIQALLTGPEAAGGAAAPSATAGR